MQRRNYSDCVSLFVLTDYRYKKRLEILTQKTGTESKKKRPCRCFHICKALMLDVI